MERRWPCGAVTRRNADGSDTDGRARAAGSIDPATRARERTLGLSRALLIGPRLWALLASVSDLVRVVQPLGSFGFSADNDGLIYAVAGLFPDWTGSLA